MLALKSYGLFPWMELVVFFADVIARRGTVEENGSPGKGDFTSLVPLVEPIELG